MAGETKQQNPISARTEYIEPHYLYSRLCMGSEHLPSVMTMRYTYFDIIPTVCIGDQSDWIEKVLFSSCRGEGLGCHSPQSR